MAATRSGATGLYPVFAGAALAVFDALGDGLRDDLAVVEDFLAFPRGFDDFDFACGMQQKIYSSGLTMHNSRGKKDGIHN
jgi:hypothetical protein